MPARQPRGRRRAQSDRAGDTDARTQEAFERALGALRRRERSTAEVEAWLSDRDFAADEIAAAVERLTDLGELDDGRFARLYAEDKRELRGWGAERIRETLLARGIARTHVEAALAGDPHARQVERAAALLGRRGEGLDSEAARGRALAYLTRRGYELEIAYDAVRRHERAAA